MDAQTILLLEYEKKTLDFLAAFLVFKGYQVLQAVDGEDALQKIGQHDVQMLIADTRMPTESGLELVRRVKALRPELVIIDYSPFVSDELTAELTKAGAFLYLQKPLNLEKLEAAVQQGLAHQTKQARSGRSPEAATT